MSDAIISLSIVAVGIISTLGVFYILSISWPRLYFGPSNTFEMFVSSQFILFSAFRVLPVALFSGASAAYSDTLTATPRIVVSATYFTIYAAFIFLTRLSHRVRYGRRLNTPDALWILTSISLAGTGVLLGHYASPLLMPALPPLSALRDAAVTAILIATLLGAARRFNLHDNRSDKAMQKAIREHSSTLRIIEARSRQYGIDRWLISAIYLGEQLQRPSWFQSFERILHSLGAPLTVGPFQTMYAPSSSIEAEIARYLEQSPAATFASMYGRADEFRGRTVASMTFSLHNNAKPFVELCAAIHYELVKLEFTASDSLPWFDDFELEIGELYTSRDNPYGFTFQVHSKIDNQASIRFKIAPRVDLEKAPTYSILPGESIDLSVDLASVSSEWVLRTSDNGEEDGSDRTFTPLDDLQFEARWDG